jgi:DnaJ domain
MQIILLALLAASAVATLALLQRAGRRRGPRASERGADGAQASPAPGFEWPENVPPQSAPGSTYRTRPSGSSPKWNPFDVDQSRAHRVRAARRRVRTPSTAEAPPLYLLLGVSIAASVDEIERAYRRHASAIHPDRFHGDRRRQSEAEAKLKQLNAAMETLRDPQRRAVYDAENLYAR